MRVSKPVVSLMSLHVEQRRQPFLFLCYVTAERREQDYPDADRRKGALQPARSRLLHLVSGGPFKSPIDIMELFLFFSLTSL